MKVFISWSGEKSRAVAEALREWLPYINAEIQPWMSGIDIDPGGRWSADVAKELEATDFGIVCVTRDNQSSAWLNFEAGALAKQLDRSRVVPLTIDLKPPDVKQPIGQFRGIELTKNGILAVLGLLNRRCFNKVPDVAEACERNWSALKPKLDAAATSTDTAPVRDQRDVLEEVLTIVRELQGGQALRRSQRTIVAEIGELIASYGARPESSGVVNLQVAGGSDGMHVHIKAPTELPPKLLGELWGLAATEGVHIDFEIMGTDTEAEREEESVGHRVSPDPPR